MSDEKTDSAYSASVPPTVLEPGKNIGDVVTWDGSKWDSSASGASLAPGNNVNDVLTWNGLQWLPSPAQSSSPTIVRATFNPYSTSTVTANGLVGEIRMQLAQPGNPFGLSAPYNITLNNTSIASGDLIFLTVRFSWLGFKESPVWPILVSVSNGQAVIALISSATHPFAGASDVYINFNIVKA